MRKIFVLTAILSGAVISFSCQKSAEIPSEKEDQAITKTFTCIWDSPINSDTKVTLANDGKTGWEVGDVIFVHANKGSNGKDIVLGVTEGSSVSADGKTATFTVSLSDLNSSYNSQVYVAYPASAVKRNFDSKNYLYYTNRFDNTNAHLITGFNDKRVDDGSTIWFKNLCACISFVVNGDFDQYIFKGNGNETVGYSTYQVRFDSNPNRKFAWIKTGSGYDFCDNTDGALKSISVSGWTGADNTTINKLYIPYEDGGSKVFPSGFTIQFLKNGVIKKTLSTSKSVDLSADSANDYTAKYLRLGNVTAYLQDYVEPTSHDATHPAIAGATALDADGNANCYIVDGSVSANAGKVFKFKAVKGNGSDGVGAIADVVVLWETYNNAETVGANSIIAQADFDTQNNEDYWITFEMPATLHAGNALIAAKNIGGDILWSWHIWVPSTTITSSTYGISSVQMMDRNLGALVIAEGDASTDIAVESCGMFYQWGRKDPFPGPSNLPNDYTSMAKVSGSVLTRDMTSSDEIYKYPNSFVETGADTDDKKDWSTEHLSTLWGSAKNENDPCPPGWKLPIFASATGDIWDQDVTDKTGLAGFSLNTTHHWLKLGVEYDGEHPTTTGFVYFPLAGYRTQDNSDYAYAGKRALIWQAYGETGSYAKCLYSDGSFKGFRTERKGRGGNVRCVAE